MAGVPPFRGRKPCAHPFRPSKGAEGMAHFTTLRCFCIKKTARKRPGHGKNCLPIIHSCSTIRARRIKGGTWRAGTSPRPYAGDATSHTAEFLRHAHYTGNPRFLQGGNFRGWVCVLNRAVQGFLYPAQPFYSPRPELPAGDGDVPRGVRLGPPWSGGKIQCAGRELPEEEAGCLMGYQAAFFRPCSPKKRKNFQNHKTGGHLPGTISQKPRKNKKERRT